MLRHLLNLECSILDPTESEDARYGDDVETYVDTTGKLYKCRLDSTKEMEYEVNRDTRKTMFRLFLGPEAYGHIDARSRVVIDSITYEVFGEPNSAPRRNRIDHLEVKLRILEG